MFQRKNEATSGTYKQGSNYKVELAARSSSSNCLGTGTIVVYNTNLKNNVHVDRLSGTLVSVGQLCEEQKTIVLTENKAIILDVTKFSVEKEQIVAVVLQKKQSGLYELSQMTSHLVPALAAKQSTDIKLWHQRLVHANVDTLKSLHKTAEAFPNLEGTHKACRPCLIGKSKNE